MIFTPPGVDWTFSYEQLSHRQTLSLDDKLLFLMVFKSYFVLKLFCILSSYLGLRSKFYCNLCDVPNMFTFAMKAEFKRQPYFGAAVFASLVVILSGILMRVFERSVSDSFSYVWNGFWLIGITISTVGYGDVVPYTHIGRVVCTIASILGLYAISYAVNSVQTSFTIKEDSELSISNSLAYTQKLTTSTKKMAATLVQRWWRMCLKRKLALPRLFEVGRYHLFTEKFKGFRTRSLKLQDPTLQDIAGSIERESTKEFARTLKHISSFNDSKTLSNSLKMSAYTFEHNCDKYANTLAVIFQIMYPKRRPSLAVSIRDPKTLKRRTGIAQKRSTIAKISRQAMQTMIRRRHTKATKGMTPGSGDSSVGELMTSFYGSTPDDSRSPLVGKSFSYLDSENGLETPQERDD
mmetsp:Transcript_7783/g.14892  ORF Transcript_7783/g.14892 Transcript_7783/m.14892 type:complete len:407 (+) Transcript_7783:425-1645(+)